MPQTFSIFLLGALLACVEVVGTTAQESAGGAPTSQQPRGYAFVNADVIPMQRREPVLEGYTVLVGGDTIAAMGPRDAVEIPGGFETIDATGLFLLPGLADMHVHLRHERELISYLRYGVTTVLQMNQDSRSPPELNAYHDQLMSGTRVGPTMYWTGPLFDAARFTPQGRETLTAEAIPAILEGHRAQGYDFIKVHNMIPVDVYRAIVDAQVLPVVGHMPVMVGPQASITSGQRMVAHAELFYYSYFFDNTCLQSASFWECVARIEPDYDRIGEMAQLVRENDVTVTANLAYVTADLALTRNTDSVLADPEWDHLPPASQAAWRGDLPTDRSFPEQRRRDLEVRYPFVQALVKALADSGVTLLAGTDTFLPGLYPGKALHLELTQLVRAGLTPIEALQTATVNAGAFIRDNVPGAERFGVVAPGARADLILVGANPLDRIENLSSLRGTMVRGRWWSTTALDSLRAPPRGR